ncbi:hypothetical protein JW968_02210 [Candidatus Woesearchaeota archaeon]|nr:hypothetical protein [Candidatus Woesearchaeota archaeon]
MAILYQRKGYAGIDEKNHGSFPEIYVAVFSMNPGFLKQFKGLSKSHNPNPDISEYLKPDKAFRYIVLTKEQKEAMGYTKAKIMVVAELIRSLSPLEIAAIDGCIPREPMRMLKWLTGPQRPSEIRSGKKFDKRYPLVNDAHHAAHILYKYETDELYARNRDTCREFMITPNLDAYIHLYDEMRKKFPHGITDINDPTPQKFLDAA